MSGSDEQLSEVLAKLTAWARTQPILRRLWLYGSRAHGSARPDSDIDLAFEIDPLLDDASKNHFRDRVLPSWRKQLDDLSPYQVHLEPWASVGTNIARYVSSGRMIYERADRTPFVIPLGSTN